MNQLILEDDGTCQPQGFRTISYFPAPGLLPVNQLCRRDEVGSEPTQEQMSTIQKEKQENVLAISYT